MRDYLLMVWDGDLWQMEGPFESEEGAKENKRLFLESGVPFEEKDFAIIPNDGKAFRKFKPLDPAR